VPPSSKTLTILFTLKLLKTDLLTLRNIPSNYKMILSNVLILPTIHSKIPIDTAEESRSTKYLLFSTNR